VSRAIDEPLIGTASIVRNWILVEQSGPWGYHAVTESRLLRGAAQELRSRADRFGIRLVLIRRPGRSAPEGSQCFVAHTGPERQWLQAAHLPGGPADLLDLDWSALAQGRLLADMPTEPMALHVVCTNGARDRCCAERGREVAGVLEATLGRRAWECSHIGGDRFAANLVCFPHGVYFGRVAPDRAVQIAAGYEAGRLDLEHYRGRSCFDFVTQAAEAFVRQRLRVTGVSDVRLIARTSGDDRLEAEFEVPGGRVRAVVAVGREQRPQPLTCQDRSPSHPPRYELVEISSMSRGLG
jgi:hypothetical protein